MLRDSARPFARQLPQLLLSPPALDVFRPAPGPGFLMADLDLSARTSDPAFRADVLAGLAAPVPAIPARWFYDHRGSELFEEITRLPEYYPTRTETALLERYSGE